MTNQQPAGDDPGTERRTDATSAQLSALALVRLAIRDEPARLSVDLLTNDAGKYDVDVIHELVRLSATLTQALADVTGVEVEQMLDELISHVIHDDPGR
ncbi:hypothetical protein [Phytoactinopolyspora mesophila]|uniref:Uncharacterized protein n=1 Tax=Phytoactinopolyspora mesophila TaxID=2650750 RepID=A0A7K3MDE2_9ACTN|nr:hypothetical protein [Phytoactinopolyspora mesophila]NDL60418.1 hypothetical protein [Phytoactinopolyspora mesophila]